MTHASPPTHDYEAARDYERIEAAIQFIDAHYQQQPSLEEIAAAIHLSPFHCQRLFSRWAGVSPKKFTQFIALGHAKELLANWQVPVLDAAYETGLSGGGRLHDLFVRIEAMTPGQFKSGGAGLRIKYARHDSPFGPVLMASTTIGICHMGFIGGDTRPAASDAARIGQMFPNAQLTAAEDDFHHRALAVFDNDGDDGDDGANDANDGSDASDAARPDKINPDGIRLHLRGTDFQIKVWEALLRIPVGGLASYGDVANVVCSPAAARATGAAIGANPVAFLIPCHRVIRKTGIIGDYRWGTTRKRAMIAREMARG